MNKIELYTDLNRDFQALMAGETSFLATLANTSALLYERLAEVNWAGFYLLEDDTLVRLIAMPNVIVTSHQAFLTKEALDNIAATTVENLLKFERGEPSPETEVCWH